MALEKKELRRIESIFERTVHEILMKLDGKVEFFNVEVTRRKENLPDEYGGMQNYYEICFKNGGKKHYVLIGCKQFKDASANIMKELEDFAFLINRLREKFKEPESIIKPVWLYWIENKEDLPLTIGNEALRYGIAPYSRFLMDQFSETIDAMSPGIAFLEFLHSYCGIDIIFEPEKLSYRCIRNQNFEKPTYTFSMPANDLLRISYVNRANINKKDLNEAYQRAVKKKRLNEIANFVVEQSARSQIEVFPNNIVANIKEFTFEPDERKSESGIIEFKNKYGSLWIIDGQHRLYSFCKIKDEDIRKRYRFVVTVYQDLSAADQADIFYTINDKQEGINSDLIMFIQAHLLQKSKGFAARIILDLDKEKTFSKAVKKGFEEKERGAWLKLSTLANALIEEGLINCEKPKGGLLQKDKNDIETPLLILRMYLNYIKRHFRANWDEGKNGFAQSNQGLAILFIILRNIMEARIKSKDELDRVNEKFFEYYLDALSSRELDIQKLAGRSLSDIRNKSDRRETAKKIWEAIQ